MTTQRITMHPAKWTPAILDAIERDLAREGYFHNASIFDPFAGVGGIHVLPYRTFGMEIEPEWATQHPDTTTGDSLDYMETTPSRYDIVATSVCYGNRMADHHEANDKCSQCKGTGVDCSKCLGTGLSPRRSYRHDLGRMPSEGSSAVMHYGPAYRGFHRRAWRGVARVLQPGGLLYANSKDFIRKGRVVRVSDWHRRTLVSLGFVHLRTLKVATPGMRYGQNGQRRTRNELVYVMRAPWEA